MPDEQVAEVKPRDSRMLPMQLIVTVLLLVPAWGLLFIHPESSSILVLASSIIAGAGGFWLGSSFGSQNKDAVIKDQLSKP